MNGTSSFVQGFFAFLEKQHVEAAVLHGWRDGFGGTLSDVDFVLDTAGFRRLVSLVNEWCESQGWILCQVLRHESTAAYCVCSAINDPGQAVALDACSDYRRNESILIPSWELLAGRIRMPSGGFRVSDEMEIRYRFTKAAVKNKSPEDVTGEMSRYPEQVRTSCQRWLRETWDMDLASWDAVEIGNTIRALRSRTASKPPWFHVASLRRILKRVLQPSGLIVIVEGQGFEDIALRLQKDLGRLHFRRFLKLGNPHPQNIKDLISSTLIVTTKISRLMAEFIPTDCIFSTEPHVNVDSISRIIEEHLHNRCMRRERLA